ncbi:hypothetical protein REPUB_Repub20aG0104600 [Reevesia pubescens]
MLEVIFKEQYSQVVLRLTNQDHSIHNLNEKGNRVPMISIKRFDKLRKISFLAGNPQEVLVRGGQSQSQSRNQNQSRRRSHKGQEQKQEQEESNGNNLFNGFESQLLEEVFDVDSKLVRNLQSQNDNRGAIVKVQREFELVSPHEE